jgi:hypothetical protein
VHIASKLGEHGSPAPIHAQVGLDAHDAGKGEHVYEPTGMPASGGGAIPGGCCSQKKPAEHVVVPHPNGGVVWHAQPRPSCCQLPFWHAHS